MRKFFTALCLAVVLAVSPSAVLAYGYIMETLGEAILRDDGLLHVVGMGLTDGAADDVLLYIDDAEIYDLRTGFVVTPGHIADGDFIRVVYDSDQALEIYTNVGAPDAADFMVVVSGNIWYSDEGCAFVTIDGKYRVNLTAETQLYDGYGYEMSFEEIVPGMEMFVWASFVTASFPGQVIPDKIVLLR